MPKHVCFQLNANMVFHWSIFTNGNVLFYMPAIIIKDNNDAYTKCITIPVCFEKKNGIEQKQSFCHGVNFKFCSLEDRYLLVTFKPHNSIQ